MNKSTIGATVLAAMAVHGPGFAASNAMTDLYISHYAANADGTGWHIVEETRYKSTTDAEKRWKAVEEGEYAKSSFKASGSMKLEVNAPLINGGRSNQAETVAKGYMFVGDVLTFERPNAGDAELTHITFNLRMTGSTSYNGTMQPEEMWGEYSLGCVTGPCRPLPTDVAGLLQLPEPEGVSVSAANTIGPHFLGAPFDVSQTVTVSFVGKRAVVPYWFRLSGFAASEAEFTQSGRYAQGTLTWAARIPRGVTCTSRSGTALGGKCIAAANQ